MADGTLALMSLAQDFETYSMTPLQEGMLFHHLQGDNLGVDIEQFVGDLAEDIDAELLREAWQRVVDRHAILRTDYRWVGVDRPQQRIHDSVRVSIDITDLSGLPADTQRSNLDQFMRDDRRRGFALDVAPLWRLHL